MIRHSTVLEARTIGRRRAAGNDWLMRGVSVSVKAGDRLTIVGPSGGGKTVLLRALTLLDPLDEGEVLWRGAAVPNDRVPFFRGHVLYLHQRTPLAEDTVVDALRVPFAFHAHRSRRFDSARTRRWLAALGRDLEFLDKSTRNLSGGESQLVALLRALQLDPEVLLLDEPTAALDKRTTRAVEELVLHWHAEQPAERALLVVTHDSDQARRIGSRRLRMERGHLHEEW